MPLTISTNIPNQDSGERRSAYPVYGSQNQLREILIDAIKAIRTDNNQTHTKRQVNSF
jgi:hypothetical protein